jgi:ATP-dependent helicase/nuclease subunit A
MHTSEVLDEFTNICLEFEQSGDKSLLSFLHWFNNSRIEIKKEISTDTEEVKVMTIHGAKGLQAKFIILPDTVSIPRNKDSVLFDQINDVILYNVPENKNSKYKQIVDGLKLNTLQEYYRLLYVGLTRASEHLLICGHSSSSLPELSWYNIINNTISSMGEKIHCADLFGYKNVRNLEEKEECFISSSDYIIKTEQGSPSKHSKPIESNKQKITIPDFLLEPYENNNICYISSPSEKLLEKTQSTEYAINIGKLTHRVLEYFVPLKRIINENEINKFIEIYKESTALQFTKKQLENICTLANNYILPLTKDSAVEVELKIKKSYRADGKNHIISGIIDLVILKEKDIHIIDYKTDKNIPPTSADIDLKYLKQMAVYKEMMESIYQDYTITCHLAWTHKPTMLKINSSRLDTKGLELT